MSHRKRSAIIGSIALPLALVGAWSLAAPIRGRMAARYDVRHGHYKALAYGLPPIWNSEYVRLLKEKYGIEMHTIALCIVSETLRSYADSYDEVSAAAANRKFGRDVFKESAEEARKRWESRRAVSAFTRTLRVYCAIDLDKLTLRPPCVPLLEAF